MGHLVGKTSPVWRPTVVRSVASLLVLLGLSIPLAGCDDCGRQPAATPSRRSRGPSKRGASPAAPPSYVATGVVEGTIRVRGEVPVDPELAARLEGRTPRPQRCRAITDEERRPVHVGTDGRTGDVLVTATFPQSVRVPPPVRANRPLLIRDCRLTPRLLAATRGDTLVMRNEDEYPFVPRVNPIAMGFMQALLQGQSRRIELERGGVFEADCGFGAACGVTTIVVLYHGIHATSDPDGHYRVEGVPADTEVELHAWHPALRDRTVPVRVGRGATRTVDFELEPSPARPAPPREPDAGVAPEDRADAFF